MKKGILYALVLVVLGAISWKTSSTPLEIIGAITGFISVLAYARQWIWTATIIGLVNEIAWFIMFKGQSLFADATLQIAFYVPLTVWGLYMWLTKKGSNKLRPTRHITGIEISIATIFTVIATACWGLYLEHTSDTVPYIDAFIAVFSIVAQYFLSRKVFQNWLMYIAVDVISIPMYLIKHDIVTSFTYLVFLIICISGLISWNKEVKTA